MKWKMAARSQELLGAIMLKPQVSKGQAGGKNAAE